MTGVTLTAKETSKVKNDTSVMEFPAGIPRPHMMRDWARSVDTALSAQGISDIAAKTIPDGKFDLLWPEDSLTSLPKLPKEASFGDMLAHRKYADEIEKRKRHNVKVKNERDEWWNAGDALYFQIITDSMIRTQPGLREKCKERYYIGSGRYSGTNAMDFIKAAKPDVVIADFMLI